MTVSGPGTPQTTVSGAARPAGTPPQNALIAVLSQQRRVLERLVFKLSECALLIAAGEERFLTMATDEVADAEEELSILDAARAVAVGELAEELGIGEVDATLSRLIGLFPAHHRPVLEDHLLAMQTLLAEAAAVADVSKQVAADRLESIRDAIGRSVRADRGPAHRYGRDGYLVSSSVPPTRVDESA